MHLRSFQRLFPLIILILPGVVKACEGDCIVEITNAFMTNYTFTLRTVMDTVVSDLNIFLHVYAKSVLTYDRPRMSLQNVFPIGATLRLLQHFLSL